jgi:hypothetical protein
MPHWVAVAVAVAIAIVGLCLAGCPGTDPAAPDGSPQGDSGLMLIWKSTPSIPGMVTGDVTIDRVVLRLRSLRAIGDAAGEGKTTRNQVELRWSKDEAPAKLVFDQAPAGKYSSIDVSVGGDGDDDDGESYEIAGTARAGNGGIAPYQIQDDAEISISVKLPGSTELAAGGTLAITLVLSSKELVGGIDFSKIPLDDGVLKIDEDHAASTLPAIRAGLAKALRRDDDR